MSEKRDTDMPQTISINEISTKSKCGGSYEINCSSYVNVEDLLKNLKKNFHRNSSKAVDERTVLANSFTDLDRSPLR